MAKDKYSNFSELAKKEREGKDFVIRKRKRDSDTIVLTPHGGKIEPRTSQIAEAIAGTDYSFYAFEGIKVRGNRDLHITSHLFDEPKCVALVSVSKRAIAVHGESSRRRVVFVGGCDQVTLKRLRESLHNYGFCVKTHPKVHLQGKHQNNICNRTMNRAGVQLELSKGLRQSFFRKLPKNGRQTKTDRFHKFIAAVRDALV